MISFGLFAIGCGGGDEAEAPPVGGDVAQPPATTPAGGTTAVGTGQAETLEDIPFELNLDQPIPPDFKAAYQRRALIAVEFFKPGGDPFYPQGLEVDTIVNRSLLQLRAEYPTIEFFSYDITKPGNAQKSEELAQGQYGSLAAQLGVGYTPFVATMAPSGDRYIIENLFQGYVPQPVLSQALFDLTAADTSGSTSDLDIVVEQIELTQTGRGLEYVTLQNRMDRAVNLQGFSLKVLDPETGEVSADSDAIQINDRIVLRPGASLSVGRAPNVVDADGDRVAGTFEGGQALFLAPGDQLALLDPDGAVAASITV